MDKYKREIILLIVVLFTSYVLGAETRDRVLVMDTGIQITEVSSRYLCKDGHYDATGAGIEDLIGHGTNIAGLIAKGMDERKQCITVLKYYHTDEDPYNKQDPNEVLSNSWNHILTLKVKWVNMSFVGPIFINEEYKLIKSLLNNGVKIAVAAGNESINFDNGCYRYPACYNIRSSNYYVVAAKNAPFSNHNGPVNVYENGTWQRGKFGPLMSGSSQATANAMAKIISGEIK